MVDDEDDFDRAHWIKALGDVLGAETLTPEDLTRSELLEGIEAQIRRRGNADLADRYQAAVAQLLATLDGRFIDMSQARTLTEVERAKADAAKGARDAAYEHFKRVRSEAIAYLLRGTGG